MVGVELRARLARQGPRFFQTQRTGDLMALDDGIYRRLVELQQLAAEDEAAD